MNAAQYRDHLLKSIPSASIASGGTHINCRCFYCPDSSNPSNKHFYISIPKNDTEPSLYYCHKCHASGVVTYKHLIQWNAYDESKSNSKYIFFDRCVQLFKKHTRKYEICRSGYSKCFIPR